MKSRFAFSAFKQCFSNLVFAPSRSNFQKFRVNLHRFNREAQDYLSEIPLHSWSFAHTSRKRIQQFTSNIAESINCKFLRARSLFYLRVIYAIVYDSIIDGDAKRRKNWTKTYTEYSLKTVAENIESGRKLAFGIIREDSHKGIVWKDIGSNQFEDRRVDLNSKSCSCKVYQDTGIPCKHVCAFHGIH